jgi:uncharacterized repeat protein (TIGR02543 family)
MMKMSLRKSIPVIVLIALLLTLPFSFGNGCSSWKGCSKWKEEVNLGISIIPKDGGTVKLSKYAVFSLGDEITITAVPATEDGYVFSHWGGAASGESLSTKVILTSDKMVEAYFVQGCKLTAAASPPEGGSVSVAPSGPLYKPGTTVKVNTKEAEGYFFTGWTGATGSTPTATVTMDKDKTVTANFAKGFKLTTSVSPAGSGSVSADKPGPFYKEGTTVTLTAKEAEDFSFDGWYGAEGDKPTTTVKMDADKTVTAHYSRVYKLTFVVDPPGSGTVSADKPGPSYKEGTTVTLTAKAADGYVFDAWDILYRSATYEVEMFKDRTVTAHFIKLYKLDTGVYPIGGGTVILDPPGGIYRAGELVDVKAIPAKDYKFSFWMGDVDEDMKESPAILLEMNGDKEITAYFVATDTCTF